MKSCIRVCVVIKLWSKALLLYRPINMTLVNHVAESTRPRFVWEVILFVRPIYPGRVVDDSDIPTIQITDLESVERQDFVLFSNVIFVESI